MAGLLPPGPGYVTAAYITSLGLDASNPSNVTAVLSDAAAVYDRIRASPFITNADLVSWANSTWGSDSQGTSVTRLNTALSVLSSMGQVFNLTTS